MKRYLSSLLFISAFSSGFAQLTAPQLVSTLPSSRLGVRCVNMDSDNDLDIVSLGQQVSGAFDFFWSENNGTSDFNEHFLFTYDSVTVTDEVNEWNPFVFADINNDGKADFVANSGRTVHYRLNLGNGSFGPATLALIPDTPTLVSDGNGGFIHADNDLYRVAFFDIDIAYDANGNAELVLAALINYNRTLFGTTVVIDNTAQVLRLPWSGTGFGAPDVLVEDVFANSFGQPFSPIIELTTPDVNGDGLYDVTLAYFFDIGTWMLCYYGNALGVSAPLLYDSQGGINNYRAYFNVSGGSGLSLFDFQGFPINQSDFPGVEPGFDDFLFPSILFRTDDLGFDDFFYTANSPDPQCFDISQDGFNELIQISPLGRINISENTTGALGNTVNNFFFEYMQPNFFETGLPSITQSAAGTMDSGASVDLVLLVGNEVYICYNGAPASSGANFTLQTWVDLNNNNLQSADEIALVAFPIVLASGEIRFTNSDGEIEFPAETGAEEISPAQLPQHFSWSASSLAFNTTELPQSEVAALRLIPTVPDVTEIQLNGITQSICEESQIIVRLRNTGTVSASGGINLHLPAGVVVEEANLSYSIENDSIMVLSYSNLRALESFILECRVSLPASYVPGTRLNVHAQATAIQNGDIVDESLADWHAVVNCGESFNVIEEHSGYTPAGYVLPNRGLDVSLRFQNEGEQVASSVLAEIPLSTDLQIASLEWWNPMVIAEASISPQGLLEVVWNDGNLVPSVQDDPESRGWLAFSIQQDANLPAGTLINSNSSVVVGSNPQTAVVSDITTIYSCADLASDWMPGDHYCVGDDLSLVAGEGWIESIVWTYNGVDQAGISANFDISEDATSLMVTLSNDLCDVSETIPLNVSIVETDFSVLGNTLSISTSGTVQWWLNGTMLSGATTANLEITESGNYAVEVTNELGCSSISESVFVQYIGVPALPRLEFLVYPNPASDVMYAVMPFHLTQQQCILRDLAGKSIVQWSVFPGMNTLSLRGVAPGVYIMGIGDQNVRVVIQG